MWPFSKPKQSKEFKRNITALIRHIDGLKKQGYKEEEIVEKLSDAGWRPHAVELVMHEAHKPNSSVEKLQEYVRKQKLKARSMEEIKETLMEAGWSEDLIDVALGF
ncbi:hypothetical protein ACFL6I_17000 [candidate division KSB1 bacterium]